MAEPLDHQIVEGIAEVLRQIRKENGYRTDAGLRVLSEVTQEDIDESETFLEVLDDTEEAAFQGCTRRKAFLQLTIAINHPSGTVTQALRLESRRILADIRRALSSIDGLNWIVGVTSLEIAGRSLFVNEAGSRYYRPELQVRAAFTEITRSTR